MPLSRIQTTLFSGDISDSVLRSLLTPPAPTGLTVTGGNAQASLSWVAPTVLSQTPITDYTIQYSSNSGSTWTTFTRSASTATSATVMGLTNGTAYVFRVAAINALGVGAFTAASSAVTPVARDLLFSNVALLLHMDGSGSTFSDSGPFQRAITVTGNATQSAAQSKFGGKSAFFDGSGDGISFSDIQLGTDDFVIEMFFKTDSSTRYAQLIGNESSGGASGFSLLINNGNSTDGQIAMYTGGPARVATQSGDWSDNQWHYLAFVRAGTELRLYVDGAINGTGTFSGSFNGADYHIGRNNIFGGRDLSGNIDEVRITKGSHRGYTGATIPVPAAAFLEGAPGADPFFSNVALLLHADGAGNTFVDSSPAPKTITAAGNATQSTAQSKFGGKSAAFDGSGDYLSVPSITLGGDFVFECWLQWNGAITRNFSVIAVGASGVSSQFFLTTKQNRTGLRFGLSNVAEYGTGSFNWVPGTWYHVALVRSSSAIRFYVDGVNVTDGSPTSSDTFTGELRLGADGSGSYDSNIYLDDVRLTVGFDRGYTGATIPVPTSAFPDVSPGADPLFSSVALLLNMDGAASTFSDSSAFMRTITAAGNSTQSTEQSKFGGKSGAFDGSGSYLTAGNIPLGSSDFVIEGWFYLTAIPANGTYATLFAHRANQSTVSGALLAMNGSTLQYFIASNGGGWQVSGASTGFNVSTNTWMHIALVRSGNECRAYLNGTGGNVVSVSGAIATNGAFSIMAGAADGVQAVTGYCDEFRLTIGNNRGMTGSSIAVPTAAFPNS